MKVRSMRGLAAIFLLGMAGVACSILWHRTGNLGPVPPPELGLVRVRPWFGPPGLLPQDQAAIVYSRCAEGSGGTGGHGNDSSRYNRKANEGYAIDCRNGVVYDGWVPASLKEYAEKNP
jgi:hypothetical protein